MPMQFELSCMGRRPLIKLFYYEQRNYRSKTIFFKFVICDRFSSLDVKRFFRPLYRCVLLRLVENKRETESLNEAEHLAIATKYKLGVLSFKMADLFK